MNAIASLPWPLTIDVGGTVEGYASLFGELDQARDMVMPGAFRDTLQRRGLRRIPMLFQHDPSEPIGIWDELVEDFRGLKARGRLIPDVARAREVLALVKAGAIDGLSIGFRAIKGRVDPATRVRRLFQVELWEISIVTFPLLAGARISAVKQAGRALPLARLRGAALSDPSAVRFRPERLYMRHPRFCFERDNERLSWRDLVLPERALRQMAAH